MSVLIRPSLPVIKPRFRVALVRRELLSLAIRNTEAHSRCAAADAGSDLLAKRHVIIPAYNCRARIRNYTRRAEVVSGDVTCAIGIYNGGFDGRGKTSRTIDIFFVESTG